ncbi:hypothetical protein WICPIJ_004972 [Wickerhamomyces pijperi]|uniref:Uncharacterized protein n=1 Tax=Wickerhamomyces pijperi TaxID=599730 RepID=A0A9P8Q6W2_WICPI|nr:hypothetical protein WICPIJ_004972 [Wickerhamomyces pijperi]
MLFPSDPTSLTTSVLWMETSLKADISTSWNTLTSEVSLPNFIGGVTWSVFTGRGIPIIGTGIKQFKPIGVIFQDRVPQQDIDLLEIFGSEGENWDLLVKSIDRVKSRLAFVKFKSFSASFDIEIFLISNRPMSELYEIGEILSATVCSGDSFKLIVMMEDCKVMLLFLFLDEFGIADELNFEDDFNLAKDANNWSK